MITKKQIEALALIFKIDQTSIFREYLQLQLLNYLYQQKEAEDIHFKGGTAIRFLLDSPRFSEDLDFSTKFSKKEITNIIKKTEKEITKELSISKITPSYQGKKSIRFKIKYQADDFKYPFVIRLDFSDRDVAMGKTISSPLVTKFPLTLFPIISHFSPEEILAEKTRAFLTRGKGRDIFDIWFMLEKKVNFNSQLINKKLKKVGKEFDKQKLIKKIGTFPQKKLERDLNQFLPQPQRRMIVDLKERLSEILEPRLTK